MLPIHAVRLAHQQQPPPTHALVVVEPPRPQHKPAAPQQQDAGLCFLVAFASSYIISTILSRH